MPILTGILTFALILVSLFLVLLVLMQKTKDGGMGAALGGGATEQAFGHETGNVLTNATIKAAIAFFVLSFVLYLGRIYESKHARDDGGLLQKVPVPATAAPITGTAPLVSPVPAATASAPAPATTSAPAAAPTAIPPAPAPANAAPAPAAPAADASKPPNP